MSGVFCFFPPRRLALLGVAIVALLGCSAAPPLPPPPPPPAPAPAIFTPPSTLPREASEPRVLLGIDVLEAEGFAAIKGKRTGLFSHAASVNRRGVPTVDVLRRAPGVQLVALFAAEHGGE